MVFSYLLTVLAGIAHLLVNKILLSNSDYMSAERT